MHMIFSKYLKQKKMLYKYITDIMQCFSNMFVTYFVTLQKYLPGDDG